jgi:hypothetical protein
VPIPTLPFDAIRILSFRLSEPVQKLIPSKAFILIPSAKVSPEWSNVKILQLYWLTSTYKGLKNIPFVPLIFPDALIKIEPFTSNEVFGSVVPIPTLPKNELTFATSVCDIVLLKVAASVQFKVAVFIKPIFEW